MTVKHNEQFCIEFEVLCGKLDVSQFQDIQNTLHQMLEQSNGKFLKDYAVFDEFPSELDNCIISPSIQLVESTFSTFRRVEKVDNLSKQVIFSETEFRKNNTMGWILQKENAMEIIFYDFVCPRELISHLWILIPGGLERGVKNNNRNFK